MRQLSRILEGRGYFWIMAVLLVTAHAWLSFQAWQGSKLALGSIIVLWVVWTLLALKAQALNRRVLHQMDEILDGWKETNDLVRDYGHLLTEATNELSTWDRDTSEDILDRTTTISLMRAQNLKRRIRE